MNPTKRDCHSLGCAGILEGTAANTFKTTNPLAYSINGRTFLKAATDSIAFAAYPGTTFVTQALKTLAAYFFFIDTAGTITVLQSAQVPNSQSASYVKGAFEWPEKDRDGQCCIGAMLIDCQNAATFTPGSVDLSATDVVDTYASVGIDYGTPIRY